MQWKKATIASGEFSLTSMFSFLHGADSAVSTSRVDKGGRGPPLKECISHVFFVLNQEWNSSTWDRNYKKRPQARSFNREPLASSVYLGRHNVIYVKKRTRPSPSVFAYCKQSKTGWWESLGTRQIKTQTTTIKELTSLLSWWVHRRVLQGQAHRTVWSLTVLPVRYDLTRRGTVRILGVGRKNRRRDGWKKERTEGRRERGREGGRKGGKGKGEEMEWVQGERSEYVCTYRKVSSQQTVCKTLWVSQIGIPVQRLNMVLWLVQDMFVHVH